MFLPLIISSENREWLSKQDLLTMRIFRYYKSD